MPWRLGASRAPATLCCSAPSACRSRCSSSSAPSWHSRRSCRWGFGSKALGLPSRRRWPSPSTPGSRGMSAGQCARARATGLPLCLPALPAERRRHHLLHRAAHGLLQVAGRPGGAAPRAGRAARFCPLAALACKTCGELCPLWGAGPQLAGRPAELRAALGRRRLACRCSWSRRASRT